MINAPDRMFISHSTAHGLESQLDVDRAAELATTLRGNVSASFEGAPVVTFDKTKTVDLRVVSHGLSLARIGLVELQRGDTTELADDADSFTLTVTSGEAGSAETTLIVPNDAREGLVVPTAEKILVGLTDNGGALSTFAIARRAKVSAMRPGRHPGQEFGANIEVKADTENRDSIYLQPGFFDPEFDTTVLTDTFDVLAVPDTTVHDLDEAIDSGDGPKVLTALRVLAGVYTAAQKAYYRQ